MVILICTYVLNLNIFRFTYNLVFFANFVFVLNFIFFILEKKK